MRWIRKLCVVQDRMVSLGRTVASDVMWLDTASTNMMRFTMLLGGSAEGDKINVSVEGRENMREGRRPVHARLRYDVQSRFTDVHQSNMVACGAHWSRKPLHQPGWYGVPGLDGGERLPGVRC